MSDSRRRNTVLPITCAESEKRAKRFVRRALRRRIRQQVSQLADPEAYYPPLLRERSDVWQMPKDGRCHYDPDDLSPWVKRWHVVGK